jgi:hypothetical protein
MACRSCAERRRILAQAKARDGIKGVVKAIPSVGRHLMANPPKPCRFWNRTAPFNFSKRSTRKESHAWIK